jgi:hypothetical protein
MNQPSADELRNFWQDGPVHEGAEAGFQRILDRYHLIDKAEPVSGEISDEELSGPLPTMHFAIKVKELFDVYPKGAVARLEEEIASRKYQRDEAMEELQAEVDRLNKVVESITIKELKPEAVGCGKQVNVKPFTYVGCGEYNELCPDCQAKANHPEKPDSSKKVSLPEVPSSPCDSDKWHTEAVTFMQAVKDRLEGME